MKARRLQQMALYIAEHKSATMEELQTTFDISMNTVRRDLAELVADGSVEKVYGGVRAKQSVSGFLPYDQRSLKPSHAKRAICSKAAELVHDGHDERQFDAVYLFVSHRMRGHGRQWR